MRWTLPAAVFDSLVHPATVFDNKMHVTVDDNEVYLHGTDEVRAAWVDVVVPRSVFPLSSSETHQFAINVENYRKVCRLLRGKELTVEFDTDNRDLTITQDGFTYVSETIDPSFVAEIWTTADPGTDIDMVVDGAALNAVLYLAKNPENQVLIGVSHNENSMYVKASGGNDTVRVDIPLPPIADTITSEFEEAYSLSYLESMQNTIPDDSTVRLQAGYDEPLRLTYAIADEEGFISFTLLPRA